MTRDKRKSSRNSAATESASRSRDKRTVPQGASRLRLWQWWLLAAAAPVVLLGWRLRLDLWGDEVYTLYHFAVQPVTKIVTDYSAPNNHILYSLVLHPIAVVTQLEPLLRLPSLFFAVATLMILFDLARRLVGLTAAVGATLALGLNVMFLTHAVQLRGYGLSMLLATGLMWLAVPPDVDQAAYSVGWRRWWRPLSIALAGAAFLYVIPTNALFLAPLCATAIAIGIYSFGFRATTPSTLGWIAAWPLALAAYWPVLDEVRAASGRAGGLLSIDHLGRLFGEVYWAAGHDLLPLLVALPVVIYRVIRTKPWRLFLVDGGQENSARAIPLVVISLAMLVGPFVACWLLGSTPFVRNFCPLLPALALLVGWYASVVIGDAAALYRGIDPRPSLPWLAMAMMAAVFLLPVLRYPTKLDAVRKDRFAQDGYYNYYAADFEPSQVADFLRGAIKPGEEFLVLFAKGDHYNLVHYLAQAGLPIPPSHLTETAPGRARARIFCVVPELANWEELSRIAGLPVAELRKFPLVDRAGYYRVYASPGSVEILLPGKQQN